jgi:hypothetical protein
MMAFIEQAMGECGASWTDKYEWEEMDVSEVSAIGLVADDEREPLRGLPPPVMPDWAGLLEAGSEIHRALFQTGEKEATLLKRTS